MHIRTFFVKIRCMSLKSRRWSGDVDSEPCVLSSGNVHSLNDSHSWNTSRTNFCANRSENHSYVNRSVQFNVTNHVRAVSPTICTEMCSAVDSWMSFCELMLSSFCDVVVLEWSEFHLILLTIKCPNMCCFNLSYELLTQDFRKLNLFHEYVLRSGEINWIPSVMCLIDWRE